MRVSQLNEQKKMTKHTIKVNTNIFNWFNAFMYQVKLVASLLSNFRIRPKQKNVSGFNLIVENKMEFRKNLVQKSWLYAPITFYVIFQFIINVALCIHRISQSNGTHVINKHAHFRIRYFLCTRQTKIRHESTVIVPLLSCNKLHDMILSSLSSKLCVL